MKYAMDVRVNIKPVFSNMVHTDIWEGPCRVGTPEELSPAYEVRTGKEQFKVWRQELENNIDPRYAQLLEPVYLEFDEKFVVPDAELDKLVPDQGQTDLYLITYRVPGIERMGKPVTMIGAGPTPLDIVPYYIDIGVGGWFAHDYQEYNDMLRLLQVKKAVAHTKFMILSATEQVTATGNACLTDLVDLYQRYGIRNNRLTFRAIFDLMDEMVIDEGMKDRAQTVFDNAIGSNIPVTTVQRDVKFYEAAKKLMETYDCNAFTISCKELCASRLPYKHKVTPCLCHSLLKDERIPSACEEDLGALLTMTFLMYLTRRSVHMGNSVLVARGSKTASQLGMPKLLFDPAQTFDRDVLEIHHAVPPMKMAGYDRPDLPYRLGHFTHEGFGTKVQVDLCKDAPEQTMTLCRFDKHAHRMLVGRAKVLGCVFQETYCSPVTYFDVEGGVRAFRQRQANGLYGNHLCMVYGDYVQDLQRLGEVAGFEVEFFH